MPEDFPPGEGLYAVFASGFVVILVQFTVGLQGALA